MHIRIIHQYFKSPGTGGGMRTYYLGRELSSRGYEVSIITATNQEKASKYELDGMKIYALPVYYTNHLGFLSRVSAFIRFIWQACKLLRRLGPADINYVLTTPLTTGIIALYARNYLKQPYYFEVGDLWPDVPIALGVLKNPLLIKLSRWLEKKSYRNASGLIGLSPAISDHLRVVAPEIPVETIPNFSPPEFRNLNNSPDIRTRLGIPNNHFVISYIGTLGMANHLEYLVDAIASLPDSLPVTCIVMGDGARINGLKEYAKHQGAAILFLPHGDQSAVKEILGISQAVYVSFADTPELWTGSPNKFFDGLSAGKAVILNFKGWLKDLLEKENLGFYYPPEQTREFSRQIAELIKDPERLIAISHNGKELAEKKYSPEIQVNILEDFISGTRP